MASLVKQRSRYYLQFYDSTRKPARKKVSLKTTRKRAAKKAQRRLEDAYALGEFDPWADDPITFRDRNADDPQMSKAVRRFLNLKREQGRAQTTITTYRKQLDRLTDRAGDPPISALPSSAITEYVRDASVSKATRRKRFRHVKAFCRWADSEGLTPSNPIDDVQQPEKADKLPKAVRTGELARICSTIESDYAEKHGGDGLRDGEILWLVPLFRFMFFTGLRGSEIGRLRWDHIDRDRKLVFLYRQKSGKEGTVPLISKADALLERIDRPDDGEQYVFCSPRGDRYERDPYVFRDYISRRFRIYRDKAGVRDSVTLHGLRHGFATALAEAGKSAAVIKEACRHASISTTMKYIHLANRRLRDEMEDVF